ncbi:unnamed protein product [Urochloa decumbens]|uniref:starch synthase n=1 Tax=Urochloa decumbens TaxID=240449 RepID=A0ABC9CJ94_9POAL
METTRLVIGAAMPAPSISQLRRRHFPHRRGGAHCLLSARAARPTFLTRCSYSSKGDGNSRESSSTVRLDVEDSSDQGTSLANEQRKGDIYELFSQAQRNILYLNKQRLLTMEELKKLQDENTFLLQEIEALEAEVQGVFPFFSLELFGKPLHVVHICSELDPIASCGSMSTYVAGVSCAVQGKGNLVEVILPKYTSLNMDGIHGLRKADTEYESYFGGIWHKNRIWTGMSNGVGVILIEPIQLSYFSRDMLCGYPDDFERFSYFSRASLDYIVKSGKKPDILHIHNWETAIVAPLFWDIFAQQGLENTRILLTCQDLNYQCLEDPNKLEMCGLDPRKLHRADRLQDPNKIHLVNILKGGIVYSNKVVLMSSIHSRDVIIQGSRQLEATLTAHKEKILVASQGLDGELWDPSKDIYLPRRYSANDIEGKSICREALKRRLGYRTGSSIIVGCICDGYSDIHNLKEAVHVALRRSAQVIFMEKLGSLKKSTARALKEEFINLDDNIAFIEEYDETLAHLIYAGSDIILCSSFEDSSLQIAMKAIKYGCAPVQINFPNDESRQSQGRDCRNRVMSKYIISTYGELSLLQALDSFKNDPSRWDQQVKDGMVKGLAWDAECYDLHWEAYSSIRKL